MIKPGPTTSEYKKTDNYLLGTILATILASTWQTFFPEYKLPPETIAMIVAAILGGAYATGQYSQSRGLAKQAEVITKEISIPSNQEEIERLKNE